jgi:hypothetical protein
LLCSQAFLSFNLSLFLPNFSYVSALIAGLLILLWKALHNAFWVSKNFPLKGIAKPVIAESMPIYPHYF